MKVVEGLKYSKEHEWVKAEGNMAYIGITDYAQHALGDIVYVELPEIGAKFKKGGNFAVIESVKAASDVYLPVSGIVAGVNAAISDDPAVLNQDAFENWMISVEMDDPGELEALMDAAEYQGICCE